MLSAILQNIATEIGVKLSWKGLSRLQLFFQTLPGWGKAQYLAELRAAIAEMPFIYRDLPLDVLGNFVDTDLTLSLDDFYKTPLPPSNSRPLRAQALETLRNYRRFVLIGDAGMGKTTLFRFAALSLINQKTRSPLLYQAEPTVVPLYVPLKALDAYSQYPILTYLQQNHAYFRGKLGLTRLTNLAQKAQLLLLLDGFDEIPVAGGTFAIKKELHLYFSRSLTDVERSLDTDPGFVKFYRSFVGNRVGLSSRREFLLANVLDLAPDTTYLFASGIGSARVRLVNNIFDRYRTTGGEFFQDRLNEETFMRDLAVSGSEALQRVSKNPLFLTVMCYVYVNALRQSDSAADMWRFGEFSLIDQCIDLLLTDIDEHKARGLSNSARTALLNRRASHRDEKKNLLRFLAAEAFFDAKAILTYTYLEQKSHQYFVAHPGPNSADILRGLTTDDATSNIVLQIIFCGVLVLTQSGAKGRAFDFPHRRFREVLAADHLNTESGFARISAAADNPALSELIPVYTERTGRRRQMIGAIQAKILLNGADALSDGYALGKLLESILRQVSDPAERSNIVEELLEELSQAPAGKRLPASLLSFLEPSPRLVAKFAALLARGRDTGDKSLASLAGLAYQVVTNPTAQHAQDLKNVAKPRSGMLADLFAGTDLGEERFSQFLQEKFPTGDIKAVSPDWAEALLELVESRDAPPKVRAILDKHFQLETQLRSGRVTAVDEILLRASKSRLHSMPHGSFELRDTSFAWVVE
jgi:hypothetical protein